MSLRMESPAGARTIFNGREMDYFAGTSYLLYACIFILGAIVALYLYAGQPDMDYLRKLLPILNLGF